jgi:uncharacterized protein (TIGR02996 family)
MRTESALLAAVCAAPEDDLPRLAFADWLEEQGDLDSAEFIRVQCRLASLPEDAPARPGLERREEELFAANGVRWREELPAWARPFGQWQSEVRRHFRRGFLADVACTATQWLKGAAKLIDRVPVERLLLKGCTGLVAEVARSPHLTRLRKLAVRPSGARARGITAADVRSLSALQAPCLTHLDVGDGGIGDEGIASLLTLPVLPQLTGLSVAGNDLSNAGARKLARAPALAGLTSFNLSCNRLGPDAVAAIASSPYLSGLRVLELAVNRLGSDSARHLADSRTLTKLEELDLGGSSTPFDEGLRLLAESPRMETLRRLRLAFGDIRAQGMEALAATTRRARLEHLDLYHCPIGDRGLAAIVRSPVAETLRVLDVRNCHVGPEGVMALAGSPHLGKLEVLRLGHCGAGEREADALLGSPHLKRLRKLTIVWPGRDEALGARLAGRFDLSWD